MVRASKVPVLELEDLTDDAHCRIEKEIAKDLSKHFGIPVIDGVAFGAASDVQAEVQLSL